jgi:ABC-type amino acid transport substrate-binding protein
MRDRNIIIALLLAVSLLPAASRAVEEAPPIRVGLYDNAPKIYRSADGKPAGFWPALVEEIAAREDLEIEWVHGTWPELAEQLERGGLDILPDVALTEARQRRFLFNQEVALVSWSRVYARPHAAIETVTDLAGKKIAVLEGSVNYAGDQGIRELLARFGLDVEFIEAPSYQAVLDSVHSGRADAGVTNKDFGNFHERNYRISRTPILFSPARLFFAFTPQSSRSGALTGVFDGQLRLMKSDPDSVYYQLLDEHLGVRPPEKPVLPEWFMPAATGALAMLAECAREKRL